MGTAEIVSIAASIIGALILTVGALWRALLKEREKSADLLSRSTHENKRDLRKALGWPTSMDPPGPLQIDTPRERPPKRKTR